jgi:SAM-dependent methyltransferase
MEISEDSISKAREIALNEQIKNVEFLHADLFDTPLDQESFDHVFVCFVLEHLSDPVRALKILFDAMKTGGTITVIEGDHGSGFWTPETNESRLAWEGLIRSQRDLGHDPNIGRRVYPILEQSGYMVRNVSPRWVYADRSNPELLDGVINKIIAPMVLSAQNSVLKSGYMDKDKWVRGLKDIENVARHPKGTFFYTWFKGVGVKQ